MSSLFEQKKDKLIFAKIIERNADSSFTVRDLKGRTFKVEPNRDYTVGQSVSVKSGIIIRKTRLPKKVRHFNV